MEALTLAAALHLLLPVLVLVSLLLCWALLSLGRSHLAHTPPCLLPQALLRLAVSLQVACPCHHKAKAGAALCRLMKQRCWLQRCTNGLSTHCPFVGVQKVVRLPIPIPQQLPIEEGRCPLPNSLSPARGVSVLHPLLQRGWCR